MLGIWLLVALFVSNAETTRCSGTIVLHALQHGSATVEQDFNDNGICLNCVACHSAINSTISSDWVPLLRVTESLVVGDSCPALGDSEPALYSRPPPAV